MKQFLALFFISAFVVSASAEVNFKAVSDAFTGFTNGLNYPELNPSFENCSLSINKTKQYAIEVIVASEFENPEAFATAIANFGFSFAQTIRSCGKAIRLVRTLIDTIGEEIRNLSQDSLTTRLFTNLNVFTVKFAALKSAIEHNDFLASGENFAEIFKVFVFNGVEIPSRRQLSQLQEFVSRIVSDRQIALDVSDVVLGIRGFIEEAETTINVNHFLRFVNDSSYFVAQFGALDQAIKAENFSSIIASVTNIYNFIAVVKQDYAQIKNETIALIQRDLPFFSDEEKIANAVEALFSNLPLTLTNIQRIVNAHKKADYRDIGHGVGAFYNQLRNGALNL